MGQLADIILASRVLEPESRAAYLACVKRFEAFRQHQHAWTTSAVESWRDSLIRQGLKPQTVNKHLYALRYATKRREALGKGPDFARAAEPAKAHRSVRVRQALDADEVALMLGTTAGGSPTDLRDRALIVVGVKTGLRASALRGMRWQDLSGKKLKVKEKGGHERVVYLDDECLIALRAWKKVSRGDGPVFLRLRSDLEAEGRRPKYARQVTPISRQAVHRIISERARAAGIARPIHPHLLRHTCVTWLLEAGVPPQRVMVMTGHKSLSTLSGYVTDLQAAKDPIGGYLPSILKGP